MYLKSLNRTENMHKSYLAGLLLDAGAVKLQPHQPFTWASGWKSPIYCDNRLTLSHPEIRMQFKKALAELVNLHFPQVEGIAGVATAGIPQAALVADVLELPLLYVRPKPKDHGRENLVEGEVPTGTRLVVIEDLVSTGGSSIKATLALRESGYEVLGMAALFTYGFPVAQQHFADAHIPFVALTDYPALLEEAQSRGTIQPEDLALLKAWREAPDRWMA
jgi:orotate phosphoribosyltransferase